ncbi:Prophage CP4-57 regulatory protein (AlpA) [compost metagenome]
MTAQLLTLKQVCGRIQVTRQTIHEWYTDGRFPKPILLNPKDARTCRWLESEVNTWIEDRVAKRPA